MLKKIFAAGGIMAICALGIVDNASAQVRVERDGDGVRVQVPGKPGSTTTVDRIATTHRASKIIGSEVKNSDGTALGKVDDFVIDDRGTIHYVVMTHGGVLGVGQKYCAVPFRVLSLKRKEDADTLWVELNVSPATLEKAPTFTSDKWPNFRDSVVIKETDGFFLDAPGVKVRADR